jgi:hypothetical protein
VTTCGATPINDGPSNYGTRAAIHAISEWSSNRTHAPAIGTRLSLTIPATGAATVNRDPATGLATGGIRLPQMTVPIGTLRGQGSSGGGFCGLFGLSDRWNGDTDPFDKQPVDNPAPGPEPVLRSLYGSPEQYAARVRQEANRARSDGFLRPADVAVIVDTAAKVRF